MPALSIATQSTEPQVEVVSLTPSLAQEWLALNVKNRNKKEVKIRLYARDMAAGNWRFTGEPIKFDSNGHLIDGQNRCYAVVASGATITVLVVRGLEPASQEVMDSGAVRTAGDALGLRGHPSPTLLAAATAVHKVWSGGGFSHCMSSLQGYLRPTNAETVEYVDQRPGLVEATALAGRTHKSLPGIAIGALSTAFYELSRIDGSDTEEFFGRIEGLQTYGKGDPINTLLKRIAEMRERRAPILASTSLFLLFRSWNAFRAGQQLQKFQFGSVSSGWATIPQPK